MRNKKTYFDIVLFANDVNNIRIENGYTYRQLSFITGISISTLSKLFNLGSCSIDTMAALCLWAELNPTSYFLNNLK